MKKFVSVCTATVLAVSLLVGGAVSASAAPALPDAVPASAEENCISGSWKRPTSPVLTDRVNTQFHKALDGLVGASYTPVALLATRTTSSGTQYRVLCKSTIVYPGAQEQYVVVTLNRSWLGRAELLDIGDALYPTDLSAAPLLGGWQEPDSPALTDEAAAAFQQATDGLLGVDYVPVALLSTQVVAGTNYRILCEATTVYPGAEMHYVVMTIYEGLDGHSSILSVSDSFASEAAE